MVAVGIGCHCHDAVAVGNRQRRDQEHQVDAGLCKQGLLVIGPGVDEGLQEVNGRDTNDGRSELDLQHGGVDMGQPFGLVRMLLKIHARDQGLVTANDHHDQEIGNHDHIDQSRHYPRDGGFGQLRRLRRAVHGDGVEDMRQRAGIAHHGADQVGKLYPEMIDIHPLREDQAEDSGSCSQRLMKMKLASGPMGLVTCFPEFRDIVIVILACIKLEHLYRRHSTLQQHVRFAVLLRE
jgi:hypothetical protein